MYILYTNSVWNKDVEAQNSIMILPPCSFNGEWRSRVSSHGSSPIPLLLGTQRLHPSLGGMAGGWAVPSLSPKACARTGARAGGTSPRGRGRTPRALLLTGTRGRTMNSTLVISILRCPFLSQWKDDAKSPGGDRGWQGDHNC